MLAQALRHQLRAFAHARAGAGQHIALLRVKHADPLVADGGDALPAGALEQAVGIALADQERVFERFFRVDKARSRATGGTGLGLAIVKHVLMRHGGRLQIQSQPGKGSTFTCHFKPSALVDA